MTSIANFIHTSTTYAAASPAPLLFPLPPLAATAPSPEEQANATLLHLACSTVKNRRRHGMSHLAPTLSSVEDPSAKLFYFPDPHDRLDTVQGRRSNLGRSKAICRRATLALQHNSRRASPTIRIATDEDDDRDNLSLDMVQLYLMSDSPKKASSNKVLDNNHFEEESREDDWAAFISNGYADLRKETSSPGSNATRASPSTGVCSTSTSSLSTFPSPSVVSAITPLFEVSSAKQSDCSSNSSLWPSSTIEKEEAIETLRIGSECVHHDDRGEAADATEIARRKHLHRSRAAAFYHGFYYRQESPPPPPSPSGGDHVKSPVDRASSPVVGANDLKEEEERNQPKKKNGPQDSSIKELVVRLRKERRQMQQAADSASILSDVYTSALQYCQSPSIRCLTDQQESTIAVVEEQQLADERGQEEGQEEVVTTTTTSKEEDEEECKIQEAKRNTFARLRTRCFSPHSRQQKKHKVARTTTTKTKQIHRPTTPDAPITPCSANSVAGVTNTSLISPTDVLFGSAAINARASVYACSVAGAVATTSIFSFPGQSGFCFDYDPQSPFYLTSSLDDFP